VTRTEAQRVVLVVDVANVMGSRPDGWWRDRVGAAQRLLTELSALPGRVVGAPDGAPITVGRVVAVVEGLARAVTAPDNADLVVVRAERDGDTALVEAVDRLAPDEPALVVTADRGLRARLPPTTTVAGPRWLLDLGESASHA